MMRWILIVIVILVALFAWRSCGDGDGERVMDNMSERADTILNRGESLASDMANSVQNAASRLGAFIERKLPDGSSLRIPERGVESRVISFIEDTSARVSDTLWYNFDRLTFETASARIDAESAEQLDNISAMLKSYPNVRIKIGGYTDNTGDAAANRKLSQDRADAVMKALVDRGIAANRLEAEGYGDAHPVASNDTEDGRAQNRRIALRVTRK